MRTVPILPISIVCVFFSFLFSAERIPNDISKVPIRPNKAQIIAEVISVEKQIFPEVELTLKVTKSESETIDISTGTIFSPSVQYRKDKEGKIVFNDEFNQKNLVVYYLLPKDIITGEITLQGDEYGRKWWLRNIERLPLATTEKKE